MRTSAPQSRARRHKFQPIPSCACRWDTRAAQQWQMKYASANTQVLAICIQRDLVCPPKSYPRRGRWRLSNVRIAGQKSGARRPPRFALSLPTAPAAVPTPTGARRIVEPRSSRKLHRSSAATSIASRVTNPANLVNAGKVLRMRQAVRHCRGRALSDHGKRPPDQEGRQPPS